MLLVAPLLIAVAVALLRGGSLRSLAILPLRGIPFFLLALALQFLLYLPGMRDAALVLRYGAVLYVLTLGLALVGALSNWRLGPGVRLATLGLALNTFVIALNGGYMPVNAVAIRAMKGEAQVRELAAGRVYNNTRLADGSTRLPLLGDVIPLRVPGVPGNVYSVGDVLLSIGIALVVHQAMRRSYTPSPDVAAPGRRPDPHGSWQGDGP